MPAAILDKNTLANLAILKAHPPFAQMEQSHLVALVEKCQLNFYQKGQTILTLGTQPTHLFILKEGTVLAEEHKTSHYIHEEVIFEEGEMFPLENVLAKCEVMQQYVAQTDVFCFELPQETFDSLIEKSIVFQQFCTDSISSLLSHSRQNVQAHYAYESTLQQSLNMPLGKILKYAPVFCTPETPVRHALQVMQRLKIGSIIITDLDNYAVGMFTLRDVLNQVILVRENLDRPIMEIMSRHLVTLPPQALAYEAALLMARKNIRHIVVVDNGVLVGVISERDLFTLQRVGLRQISSTIKNAVDLTTLVQASKDIRQLACNMLAQGVAAEQLTQFISTLNDLLTEKVLELNFTKYAEQIKHIEFCWLTFGSEGRYEQTLSTDQDNGLIFIAPEGMTADEVRTLFLPINQEINKMLDACGFPLCKGNIMASNPDLCLSLEEWENCFSAWIHKASAPELLNAMIFFDFRGSYGRIELAKRLRESLKNFIKESPMFLKPLVVNALANKPAISLLKHFVTSKKEGKEHMVDLKMNGVGQFVDAARVFALSLGLEETNTAQRIRFAGKKWNLNTAQVEAWIDAFHFIQTVRLRLHDKQLKQNEETNNYLDPDSLSDLDKRILKEAFQQARKLQSRLEKYFQF